VAAKPKDIVSDTRPAFKRPGSISISAPITVQSVQSTDHEGPAQQTVVQNTPFTDQDLFRAWQQFADTIPEQGRMASLFLSTIPQLTSATTFEITVSNVLQEKELKRLQPDILGFIHSKLENSQVRMSIKIAEETEVQRANSPEDRYKILAEQNPALDILKNGLQLEID